MFEENAVLRVRAWGRDTPLHRIAPVHRTPGLYEASDLLETAAVNRSLNVKNFRALPAALAWLE
ncbi:MAG TPA: hypothetical protein VI229_00580 [Burkholderiales bacterium]